MGKIEYIMQKSYDGELWTHVTTFRESEIDRWGKPLTLDSVLLEAKDFKESQKLRNIHGDIPQVRIVILV